MSTNGIGHYSSIDKSEKNTINMLLETMDYIPNGIQDANITNSSVKGNLSAFIVQQCVRFAKLGQKN